MPVKSIVLFFYFSCTLVLFSQDFNQFNGLKSTGKIPKEFLESSLEKYQQDLENNENELLDKTFFLSTRFFIDQLLLSGQVLFNEPLSNYLNKVADYALESRAGLAEQLQFYVLKSTEVNAFSTDQGIIFFTTGLLAQLENEAQLAYILCHEVSHFTEKHVQDSYVERNAMLKGKNKYNRLGRDDRITEMSVYKKSNELDADSRGIDMYLETEYRVDEIISSFGVLLYSYLPFQDLNFDTSFFDTQYLNVPGFMFSDTINPITKEEDYDDSRSTHPNIKTRIDNSVDIIGDRDSKGDKQFVISESDFYDVRNLARFEGVRIKLANRRYIETIYDIFLLKREFPNSEFLDFSFVKAFYGISKYKNHGRFSEIKTRLSKVEGESYRLQALIQKLSKSQLNVMAYRYAYDLVKKYPENNYYKKYEVDLKSELATNKDFEIGNLKAESYQALKDSVEVLIEFFDIEDSIQKIEASDLSRYQKIKLKKKLNAIENISDIKEESPLAEFHYYALRDMVKNDNLIEELMALKNEGDGAQNFDNTTSIEQNESLQIGIDSIILLEPYCFRYDAKGEFDIEASEKISNTVNSYCKQDFEKLSLHKDVVSPRELSLTDIEKYNQISILSDYLQEKSEHDDLGIISSCHQDLLDVKRIYGSSYMLYSQFDIYEERKNANILHAYGALLVLPLPLVLYDLRKRTTVTYRVLLLDIEDDDYLYRDNVILKTKAYQKNIELILFHVFKNINSK